MLRRVAIVSAFAASLLMSLLAGCGVRGPLVMPKRPPEPSAPAVPDPGLSRADAASVPVAPTSAPTSAPASATTPAAAPASK